MKSAIVIGSGFAGLATATTLASSGYKVSILEKNSSFGGRARKFETQGFTFDMGPSWYWMPAVFEEYFEKFGKNVSDYYQLKRLDPSYSVCFGQDDFFDVPASVNVLKQEFEQLETGSAAKLDKFLKEASYKYEAGMSEYVWKPGKSILEFADFKVFKSFFRLQMLSSVSKQVRTLFKHPKIRAILEFPVLFLGATPQDTPALYTLMNHADLQLGTWYPMGGMHKIVEAMVSLAKEKGVEFHADTEVLSLEVDNRKIHKVVTQSGEMQADVIVASADYHHVDQQLLASEHRSYTAAYWDKRKMAPSSLLFYIGLDTKIKDLHHHTLFFDADFDQHAEEIYKTKQWPKDPLFYMCAPSVTDSSVAPEGMENIFLLMPLAPDIKDTEELREQYFQVMVDRIKDRMGVDISKHIVYKRSYCVNDFKSDYHSYKGNAYGLANTLDQTAILKPSIKSKKVDNLFYCGQLSTPGPGVPPSLISGQLVAQEIIEKF